MVDYLDKNVFKLQDSVCNSCHDFTILNANISNIAIITLKMLIIVVLLVTLVYLMQLIN